eukprot:362369-Pyramimonas_sp.AAC.1
MRPEAKQRVALSEANARGGMAGQRQLNIGGHDDTRQRHALRGAAAPCELRCDSAEPCVTA